MNRPQALVIDHDPRMRARLREALSAEEFRAAVAASEAEALGALTDQPIDLLVVAEATPGLDLPALLRRCAESTPAPIVVTRVEQPGTALERLRDGVFDVLDGPADGDRLRRLARRLRLHYDLASEVDRLRSGLQAREGYDGIVGRSAASERLRAEVQRLAPLRSSVWIAGPPGSGKELVARTLHAQSARGADPGPFIVVSCSSLTERTEDGWDARWNGRPGAPGLLPQAAGGTLLLEEPTALEADAQTRLSDLIERAARTDGTRGVRVISASTSEPRRAATDGRLELELSRRLADEMLSVPALRDRAEDIPLLARHFVETVRTINQLPPIGITPETISLLERYAWPDNVQELRNAMEQAVIVSLDGTIRPRDLPGRIRGESAPTLEPPIDDERPASRGFREAKREVVDRFESRYLGDLMERHGGNVTAAAQGAGMLRSALQRLLRKHEIKSAEYRRQRRASPSETGARPRR